MSYKVSTITCNGNINIDINPVVLFHHFPLNDKFVWIEYINECRGEYPKHKKRKEKKNCFDNQVTVIYKFSDKYCPNCKIFQNGNIQMTGVKKHEDGLQILQDISDEIRCLMGVCGTLSKSPVDLVQPCKFVVRMINSDFSFGYSIRRKQLHKLLISPKYSNSSSFQPIGYPGVKLQYFWNSSSHSKDGVCRCSNGICYGKGTGHGDGQCKKVTIAIFESGNVLITGGNSFDQINEAYSYITNVVKENREELEKTIV